MIYKEAEVLMKHTLAEAVEVMGESPARAICCNEFDYKYEVAETKKKNRVKANVF